jgi:transcriptional regulator with PAS, ATPase and Fis domain
VSAAVERLVARPALPSIIAASAVLRDAVALARRFAVTDVPILLVGPTGTGKELFALHIHEWSGVPGELVDVNCATLPKELADAQLFGCRRGAYTGSVESTPGLIEAADGGTLFLDELCSLPQEVQAKLLRVVETGESRRLGETTKRRSDFRLLAATQPLDGVGVETRVLRADLLQRVAGVIVELPPFVERLEDVIALAEHFAGAAGKTLEPSALDVLCDYRWPGNVRELRRVIERAACLARDGTLDAEAVSRGIALGRANGSRLETALSGLPSGPWLARVVAAGRSHGWHAGQTAAALGINRATLFRRLKAARSSIRQLQELAMYSARTDGQAACRR